jgi:hypothetical protein
LELVMGKYEPLGQFLRKQKRNSVSMTFAEIEALLGDKLPKSSKTHRAWWSNNPSNNVMTREWLEAGYETKNVDLAGERLVFQKVEAASSKPRKSIFGCMKGMVTLPPDFDPERPFHDLFDMEAWEANQSWVEDLKK